MARGIYGQSEGNETRIGTAVVNDHFRANEIAEGMETATLKRMAKEHDWKGIEKMSALLKSRGHAQYRIDAMLNQAMAGVRL